MMEFVYPAGVYCELSRKVVENKVVPPMEYKSTKHNYPELIKALRAAKTKGEGIAAMRRYIVWNDAPEDVNKKLDDWTPPKVYK